ncbi:hypothetical protein [Okeania sp. SIO3I5]|uniref:hypothetical protein n=1 Tax=Okeania sp. SIO3I5 TaxID=2607805 RepID=UPI0025DA12CF|nr:hypothetical protein [Okeania sp. SIO3I5]
MPIKHFTGNQNYGIMACHVFALSGDHNHADAVHQRYQTLGHLLLNINVNNNNNNVPQGLNVVTNQDIINVLNMIPGPGMNMAILNLLCQEFGLAPENGSGIRLWGHFEEGQMLPEHMYVTINGMIYDTMPNAPVRKRENNAGLNPPSYGNDQNGNDVLLDNNVVFSVEVQNLAQNTLIPINAPNNQWADGMG